MPANIVTMDNIQSHEETLCPPRSRLYCLRPIGLGTPYVESLTSYIMRLAEAHCVHPRDLMVQEVLPHIEDSYQKKYSRGTLSTKRFRSEGSQTFNGSGELTGLLVRALHSLTSRSDLQFLTMLPWSSVLPQDGNLRKVRAWCPKCYEEWQSKQIAVYEPLLWSLRAVTVCPLHEQVLHSKCPYEDCRGVLPALAHQARPGICSRCGRWLGISPSAETSSGNLKNDLELQIWSVHAVGELLAAAPALPEAPQQGVAALKIASYVDHVARGSRKFFAQQIQVPRHWVERWEKGQQLLSLETLTKVCYYLGISPLLFLTEELSSTNHVQNPPTDSYSYRRAAKGKGRRFDANQLRRTLEAILASDETPVPSLSKVASRLGYDNTYILNRYFPELSQAITARYLENVDIQELHSTLEKILADDESFPLPLSGVARRLGFENTRFIREHFPDLSDAIASRYRDNFNADELRRALERDLASGEAPPPSLSEVARRLGYNRANALYKYCPDLSRAIAARYRRYFEVDRIEAALAAIMESNEVPPPTLKMVAKRLGYSHANILRKQFPKQCQVIVARWRTSMDIARVEELLQEILMSDEVPFPSLPAIAKRVGQNKDSLRSRFPELCQAIIARYRAHFDFSKVRTLLEAVLENEEPPYPSFNEVSARIGYHPDTLRQRFPWLASKISERYFLYRKKIGQEKIQRICQEVRAAVYTLHGQGMYPSVARVSCLLSYPNDIRERCAHEARHRVLRELGWE